MSRTSRWFFLWIGFLSPLAFCDGGTLQFFNPSNPESYEPPWPVEDPVHPIDKRMMEMRELNETGYLLERESNNNKVLVFISETSNKVYSDMNQDGLFQKEEIVSYIVKNYASPSENSFFLPLSQKKHYVLPLPLELGKTNQTIFVLMKFTTKSRRAYFEFPKILSHYRGEIAIGGESYPACLVFRTPFPYSFNNNEIIIIDSNRDGSFDRLDDAWFSSQGIAYFKDSPWMVSTAYENDDARIAISPYQGPAGSLKMEGTHIFQTILQCDGQNEEDSRYFFYPISLPIKNDPVYLLPVGNYSVTQIWLKSNDSRDVFYQGQNLNLPVEIVSNQETIHTLGNPMKLHLTVSSYHLGFVSLKYKDIENSDHVKFTPISRQDLKYGNLRSNPRLEIRNNKGTIVAQGILRPG